VGNPDLDQAPPGRTELDEQLGGEEGAARLDADALERLAPEELAGAVDVADAQPEEDPVGQAVGLRVCRPDGRVGAPDAVADDDIRAVVRRGAIEQPPEIGDLELAVAVGERDEVEARGPEAGPERRPVAKVGRVMDGPDDARMGLGQAVRDRRRGVTRTVVDGDDLELIGQGRQGDERLLDQRLEVRLLVVGREEVRQPRPGRPDGATAAGRGMGRRSPGARSPSTRSRLGRRQGHRRHPVAATSLSAVDADEVDGPPPEGSITALTSPRPSSNTVRSSTTRMSRRRPSMCCAYHSGVE
jgi:hypothetical protein